MSEANPAAPVVIVGAAMGGLRAAESLRRSGYTGAIRVVGDELHAPYNRPPLSKEVLATDVTHEAVAFPSRAEMGDVEWMLGVRASAVDLDARTLTTDDGNVHEWRALVIATGLRARRLDFAPITGRHVVRSLDDAMALRAELTPGARVVVVGSGFLGCELSATARKLGCAVTIVTPSAEPMMRPLGDLVAKEMRRRLTAEGVEIFSGVNVAAINGEASVESVELSDGTVVPADVLIESVGSDCNSEWLADTDLDLSDGVLADNAMRAVSTSGVARDDVYVVGDIARFPNPMFDDVPRRIEHWNIPTDTGKRAGAVLAAHLADDGTFADVVAKPFAPMPSFWSNQFEIKLQAYGLLGLVSDDDIRILEGDLTEQAAVGYYRDDRLVGVLGIGMKAALLPYRKQIADGGS
ncbi:NAD(P)/FAD-dependent oxidoreductase [Salinibacterium sp. M195]|uniref:NAD(P)/FAD-dependent oxidoreductase n=1 Tax=Salinibacterium sp. M195 TaxID=2583374 RepID=UPI001C626EC6|nr:FAD-dependent oxidoreductase [Salinibacterium sp. M195]QYH36693.1 NAD(P)/FAD-dependent oxidoreductase [Salinibacterium sp. M195]